VVTRVQFTGAGIGIDGVRDLVVAALVKAAQVKPDLRDIWVDADGTRICIKSVTELVDLKVEYSNRTPKGGVPTVTINSLLVSFICLIVLLASHISTTKKIPALGV